MDMAAMISRLVVLSREEQRQFLIAQIERLEQGQGGAILLKCEQELGQNMLVRSILQETETRCYHGVCPPYPYLEPYGVFWQLFPYFFSSLGHANRQSYNIALSVLNKAWYRGPLGKITRKTTRKTSRNLPLYCQPHTLHIQFAKFLCKQAPAILFLEDVHWADLASFKLLNFLLVALKKQPILFLFTAVPEVVDSPELPPELRGANIPAIQQVQAMQLANRFPLSSKGRREFLQELESELHVVDFPPLANSKLELLMKKVLGPSTFSEPFSKRLVKLAQGNILFLGQIFLYLLDNVLVPRGKRWQLQCHELDIDLPQHIENILQENLDKLEPQSLLAAQYAAMYGSSVPMKFWQEIVDNRQNFTKVVEACCRYGIIQIGEDQLYFNSDSQRQAVIQPITVDEHKQIHSAWANYLEDRQVSAARLAYHKLGSDHPDAALEHMLAAGLVAETTFAYEEACEFYREAAKAFPEIGTAFMETFRQLEQKMQEKDKQLAQELPSFIEGLRFYRIAALVAREPMFGDDQRKLLKKIAYKQTPDIFFPTIAPLLLFLLKIAQLDPKMYPQSDIGFLLDFVAKDLIPGGDHNLRLFFFREASAIPSFADKYNLLVFKSYEKWGDSILHSHPQKACEYYFAAAFFAQKGHEFFHCARILHKIVKCCQNTFEQLPKMRYLQIEALRRLGDSYEECAEYKKTQIKKDKRERAQEEIENLEQEYLHYAIQSTAAYRDAVNLLWAIRDSSWLSQHLMTKASAICETYYLENNAILAILNSAKIKQELMTERDYQDKALLIVASKDVGAADLIEEAALQENVELDIQVSSLANIDIEKHAQQYCCSFLLISTCSREWQSQIDKLRPLTIADAARSEDYASGWFVREIGDHTCFILMAELPGQLYRIALDFCSDQVMRRYM